MWRKGVAEDMSLASLFFASGCFQLKQNLPLGDARRITIVDILFPLRTAQRHSALNLNCRGREGKILSCNF